MCGHHYIQTNSNNVKKNVVFLFHFVIRIHLNVFQLYIYIYIYFFYLEIYPFTTGTTTTGVIGLRPLDTKLYLQMTHSIKAKICRIKCS